MDNKYSLRQKASSAVLDQNFLLDSNEHSDMHVIRVSQEDTGDTSVSSVAPQEPFFCAPHFQVAASIK